MSEITSPKERAREQITDLTLGLVDIVNRRAQVALEIGSAKVAEGATQVRDLEREQLVIDLAAQANTGPLSTAALARIVQTIMNETSMLQSEVFDMPVGVPLDQGPGFDVAVSAITD